MARTFVLLSDFIVEIFILPVLALIAIAIHCAGLSAYVAFAISFETTSFTAIAAPNLLGFEYFFDRHFLISMSLFLNMLDSRMSLILVLVLILAILTFTQFATKTIIMEAWTIHFQTTSLGATTWLPLVWLVFFWDFLWGLIWGEGDRFMYEEIGKFEVLLIYCGIPGICGDRILQFPQFYSWGRQLFLEIDFAKLRTFAPQFE